MASESEEFSSSSDGSWKPFLNNFIAGTFGGFTGIICGHPLDTVKVRLQSQSFGGFHHYSGTLGCLRSIIAEESFRGLYKGMSSPMAGVLIANACLFGVYGFALDVQMGDPTSRPTLTQIYMAGCASGVVNSFVSCPTELVKIRLQNQSSLSTGDIYKGSIDGIRRIVQMEGYKGLFRGMGSTLLREIPSYGVYFASYEYFCQLLAGEEGDVDNISGGKLLVAGGFAGIFGWVSTYPVDVLKTKLQAQGMPGTKIEYKGMFDCAVKCYRNYGMKVFFEGINATILRAFPTNAAIFFGYTLARRTLEDLDSKS